VRIADGLPRARVLARDRDGGIALEARVIVDALRARRLSDEAIVDPGAEVQGGVGLLESLSVSTATAIPLRTSGLMVKSRVWMPSGPWNM
jgi:hypothetical protein